jgi:hypothetical protein
VIPPFPPALIGWVLIGIGAIVLGIVREIWPKGPHGAPQILVDGPFVVLLIATVGYALLRIVTAP